MLQDKVLNRARSSADGNRSQKRLGPLRAKLVVEPPDRVKLFERPEQLNMGAGKSRQFKQARYRWRDEFSERRTSAASFALSLRLCSASASDALTAAASSAAASARYSIANHAGNSALSDMGGSPAGRSAGVLSASGLAKAEQVDKGLCNRLRVL